MGIQEPLLQDLRIGEKIVICGIQTRNSVDNVKRRIASGTDELVGLGARFFLYRRSGRDKVMEGKVRGRAHGTGFITAMAQRNIQMPGTVLAYGRYLGRSALSDTVRIRKALVGFDGKSVATRRRVVKARVGITSEAWRGIAERIVRWIRSRVRRVQVAQQTRSCLAYGRLG